MTPSDYGIAVGQRWYDEDDGERLTITGIDASADYPIQFKWASGGEGADDVRGFLHDFVPLDLRSYLEALVARERAATAEDAPERSLSMVVTTIGRCPSCDEFPSEWNSGGMECSECGVSLTASIRVGDDGCEHWSFDFEYQHDADRVAAERAASKKEGT